MSETTNPQSVGETMTAPNSVGTTAGNGIPETGVRTILDLLPDAPVPKEALLPTGYGINTVTDMVVYADAKGKAQTPLVEPLLVTRQLVQPDGQTILDLAVQGKGSWRSMSLPAEAAASKRELVRHLASQGLTVDDGNAGEVLRYLREFRRVNSEVIPSVRSSPHAGWLQDDRAMAFALGRDVIGPGASGFCVRANSKGEEQILDYFGTKGSFDAWKAMLAELPDAAPAWLGLYAAALPPLMHLIGRDSVLMLEFVGTTSLGKTTALQLAASLYGIPGGNGSLGLVQGWNQTGCAQERRAGLTPDLPIILDELSADAGADVENRLYQLATGQAKQRAQIEGLRESTVYRGVLLSSGEESIESKTRKSGLLVRLASITEPPFMDDQQAELVRHVKDVCRDNYGHAGRRLVEFLASMDSDKAAEWQAFARSLEVHFRKRAQGAVAGRAAEFYGLLAAAGEALHQACQLDGNALSRVEALWESARTRFFEDVPLLGRVMDFIQAWYGTNCSRFPDLGAAPSGDSAAADCWGGTESGPDGTILVVQPAMLETALRGAGFDPKVAVAELKRGKLLCCDGDHHTAKRKLPNGQRVRCYVVRIEGAEGAGRRADNASKPCESTPEA